MKKLRNLSAATVHHIAHVFMLSGLFGALGGLRYYTDLHYLTLTCYLMFFVNILTLFCTGAAVLKLLYALDGPERTPSPSYAAIILEFILFVGMALNINDAVAEEVLYNEIMVPLLIGEICASAVYVLRLILAIFVKRD